MPSVGNRTIRKETWYFVCSTARLYLQGNRDEIRKRSLIWPRSKIGRN